MSTMHIEYCWGREGGREVKEPQTLLIQNYIIFIYELPTEDHRIKQTDRNI
jgi:hypothetical protein